MGTPDSSDSAASRLCTACGMCCNGTLFHMVMIAPEDSVERLYFNGLKLSRTRKKKELYIQQPCNAFKNCQCSIYPDRPTRCRLFECGQLKAVASGKITEEEAGARIREALARVRALEELFLLAGETCANFPLIDRHFKLTKYPLEDDAPPEDVALREEIERSMEELEALFKQHFRP